MLSLLKIIYKTTTMSSKKVLLVGPSLGRGGAERVMADMSVFLDELGYKVTLITAYRDVDYHFKGTHITLGLCKGSPILLFQTIWAFFRWKSIIKKISPEIEKNADSVISAANQIYDGMHSIIKQLRPGALDNLGLAETLKDTVNTWQKQYEHLKIHLFIKGDLNHLNETLNIKNQEDKNNLYNVLNNFCVLNNSKEDLSILVIVDDNESNYNIDNYKKYKIIMKNDVDTIKLDDYNVLINLSNDTINTIIHKFLTINSDKSYNFIVDKDKNRLEYTNNKFCIKDFMAFKISSKNQYSYLNPL